MTKYETSQIYIKKYSLQKTYPNDTHRFASEKRNVIIVKSVL